MVRDECNQLSIYTPISHFLYSESMLPSLILSYIMKGGHISPLQQEISTYSSFNHTQLMVFSFFVVVNYLVIVLVLLSLKEHPIHPVK